MQDVLPVVPVNGNTSIYTENLDQCIKGTYQFAGTLYQNICDGSEYFIANGFWDFAIIFIIASVGIALVGVMVNIICL